MPKIVVLDGHTLNPGDLDWSPLRELGDCVLYDRTPPEEVVPRATGADLLLINKIVLNRETLAQLRQLRYIGVLATGYNVVDIAAAKEQGIAVTNIPTYGTASVAQMTFALLLELTNQAALHSADVRAGGWSNSPDFCYWKAPLAELSGKTFGVVGYGRIGRAAAQIARAFGMTVAACNARLSGPTADDGTPLLPLNQLLECSDVVSLHCPQTADNYHLIDSNALARMKPNAFLLNTSRGGLVDAEALAAALQNGKLAGAGIDVLETEPPSANPLLTAPLCLVTPHISWATVEARRRLLGIAVENIRTFLAGKPRNMVT